MNTLETGRERMWRWVKGGAVFLLALALIVVVVLIPKKGCSYTAPLFKQLGIPEVPEDVSPVFEELYVHKAPTCRRDDYPQLRGVGFLDGEKEILFVDMVEVDEARKYAAAGIDCGIEVRFGETLDPEIDEGFVNLFVENGILGLFDLMDCHHDDRRIKDLTVDAPSWDAVQEFYRSPEWEGIVVDGEVFVDWQEIIPDAHGVRTVMRFAEESGARIRFGPYPEYSQSYVNVFVHEDDFLAFQRYLVDPQWYLYMSQVGN